MLQTLKDSANTFPCLITIHCRPSLCLCIEEEVLHSGKLWFAFSFAPHSQCLSFVSIFSALLWSSSESRYHTTSSIIYTRGFHPMNVRHSVTDSMLATSSDLAEVNSRKVKDEVREILRQNRYGSRKRHCWEPQRLLFGSPLTNHSISDSFAMDVQRFLRKRSGWMVG